MRLHFLALLSLLLLARAPGADRPNVLFIAIDLMLTMLVIRPLNRMSLAADEISKGNLKIEEFDERGKDEVARLAASFNRMKRSLEKAMALFYSQSGKK